MREGETLVTPGSGPVDFKHQVLQAWLDNPFLDDDLPSLALRLGGKRADVGRAVDGLVHAGLLRPVGGGGYALTVDLGGAAFPHDLVIPPLPAPPAGPPDDEAGATLEGAQTALASLSGALEIESEDGVDEDAVLALLPAPNRSEGLAQEISATLAALSQDQEAGAADLLDVLPFGILVLRPSGAQEMANGAASRLLGVPLADLDGATFEMATGVNPLSILHAGPSLTFSLTEPQPLEISLRVERLAAGEVILIFLRDVSLLEEVSRIHGDVQEELYERMRRDLVDPLTMIEAFIETPDAQRLVTARFAMEQINAFLRSHFISRRDAREGQGPAPA